MTKRLPMGVSTDYFTQADTEKPGPAVAFTELTDAPNSYATKAYQLVYVRFLEDGLAFTGKLFWDESNSQLLIQDKNAGNARFSQASIANGGAPLGGTSSVIYASTVHEAGTPTIYAGYSAADASGENPVETDLDVIVAPEGISATLSSPAPFTLGGMDVAASGTTEITVAGVQRTLQYALHLKINGVDVYFPGFATAL